MLNKAILVGRLTADPELKQTPSGVSVCSFSIAINRPYSGKGGERQTDFIDIVAWRNTAEFVTRYFCKGNAIGIDGSIQTRSYTDKQGSKRTAFEVVADAVSFVESKNAMDSQRESKLRPVLERLLPIMAMSAWGMIPEGIEVAFPPLWTPTAKEVAEIAKAKTEAVISAYTAGLLNVDTAQRELKNMSDETGLYTTLSDAEIAANKGKTYQDATALRDPLMGLPYEEEPSFEPQDSLALDYSPSQPRDKNGKWTSGGGSGTIKGTKYAPSPQRTTEGIQLSPKTYARLTGVLNTRFPGLREGEVRKIRDTSKEYTVKADGFGGFQALMVIKIK